MKRKKRVSLKTQHQLRGKWQESFYATYNTINGYGIMRHVQGIWCLASTGFHNTQHFIFLNQAGCQRWLLGFYFLNDMQSLVHVNI